MVDRGRLIYSKSLTKGKIQMVLTLILISLILLISIAMWRAGMISSNFYLILIGIILTIFCISQIPWLLFDIYFLDFKIFENGIDNPVPLIKKYRRKSFYQFDNIINIYTTNIHLIIETEEGENPIALNLLGKNYNKILQIALEAKKSYYEKNISRI